MKRNRSITQHLRLRINNSQKYLPFKMLSPLISIPLLVLIVTYFSRLANL